MFRRGRCRYCKRRMWPFHRRCRAEMDRLVVMAEEAIAKRQDADSKTVGALWHVANESCLRREGSLDTPDLLTRMYLGVVAKWYRQADVATSAFYRESLDAVKCRFRIQTESEERRRLELLYHLEQDPL